MIFVLCNGGIGNQMFQYAYFVHLAESGKNAVLDTSYFLHYDVHSGYALGRAFGIEGCDSNDHFNEFWKRQYRMVVRLELRLKLNHLGCVHMERNTSLINEKKIGKKAILFGYWQGEQFFGDVIDKVKEKFSFINISDQSYKISRQMSAENSIAVHIRRGDYLKSDRYVNLSSTRYYQNAMAILKEKMDNPRIYVFSDDISWCRQSGLFDENAYYVDHNDGTHDYEDMFLMSQCKAVIMANSTFSWWGAYLGHHEYVVRPEKYKTVWSKEQDDRFFPKEWIVGKFAE